MKLYVMRHGPAEDRADSGADADRALTAGGRERVRSVAAKLLDEGEEPVHLFTSPLVRAVQTAEIVAVVTQLGDRGGELSTRRELSPAGPAIPMARRLASSKTRRIRRVMLVGHEPDLSELVAALVDEPFDRPFDKAMVVGLHLGANGKGRLRFVLDPKTLEMHAPRAP